MEYYVNTQSQHYYQIFPIQFASHNLFQLEIKTIHHVSVLISLTHSKAPSKHISVRLSDHPFKYVYADVYTDLQVSAALDAHETVCGHVHVRDTPLMALQAFLVVLDGRELT